MLAGNLDFPASLLAGKLEALCRQTRCSIAGWYQQLRRRLHQPPGGDSMYCPMQPKFQMAGCAVLSLLPLTLRLLPSNRCAGCLAMQLAATCQWWSCSKGAKGTWQTPLASCGRARAAASIRWMGRSSQLATSPLWQVRGPMLQVLVRHTAVHRSAVDMLRPCALQQHSFAVTIQLRCGCTSGRRAEVRVQRTLSPAAGPFGGMKVSGCGRQELPCRPSTRHALQRCPDAP